MLNFIFDVLDTDSQIFLTNLSTLYYPNKTLDRDIKSAGRTTIIYRINFRNGTQLLFIYSPPFFKYQR